jgi:hypothetical protein
MSGLIYMPKPHEQHKYGGFVSLTPVEFAQMGRYVIRNGIYVFMIEGSHNLGHAIETILQFIRDPNLANPEVVSRMYSSEFAPEKCQNALKEVIKQLE